MPEALEDLFAFTRRTDLPPLTRAAIAHAHFETIHPFVDGNGRTGRALIHVLLSWAGLTPHAPLPLSAVLLADVDSYFRSLDAYRRGEPLVIVEFFIGAAARRSLERLEAAGLLRGYLIGPHRRAWRSPEILDLMDDVASAPGRRARPGTR